jgi:excisionase family DNA binding protein
MNSDKNTLQPHEAAVPFHEVDNAPSLGNSRPVEHSARRENVTTAAQVLVSDESNGQLREHSNSPSDGFCKPLLTVREAACLLNVSQSWIRRHIHELPVVRLGRAVRLDSALLLRQTQGKLAVGNRLKTGEKMSLRRYQRGYLYKTGKRRKVWYGMWREDVQGSDAKLSRRQRNVRIGTVAEFPTRAAALEELARRMCSSKKLSIEMTLSELFDRWQKAVVPTIKESTAAYYQKILQAHIVPIFGKREISSIGRYDVETFLAERSKVYSRNTLRGMRVSLGRLFTWAVACEWLEKNPCAKVKLPQAGKRVVRTILKPSEVTAIAERLAEPYSTLVLFLAVTGLRIGEAIGIKWTDFEGDVLHISRRIYEGKSDTTKTKGSDRSLPIPKQLLERMRLLGGNDWVFRSREGTPVNPGNALKRYIRPVVRGLGISLGGWHDFRHTLTTGLLRTGVSPKVVSNILGHSDVQITLDIYDHPDIDSFRVPLDEVANQLL